MNSPLSLLYALSMNSFVETIPARNYEPGFDLYMPSKFFDYRDLQKYDWKKKQEEEFLIQQYRKNYTPGDYTQIPFFNIT
jgi:hypothetical protein